MFPFDVSLLLNLAPFFKLNHPEYEQCTINFKFSHRNPTLLRLRCSKDKGDREKLPFSQSPV